MKQKIFLAGLIFVAVILAGCANAAPTETADQPSESGATTIEQAAQLGESGSAPTKETVDRPTVTPTPEADPKNELGGADWVATFGEGTAETWFQFEDEQAKAEMKEGELVLTSFKDNGFDTWSMSYPVLSDFYLDVTFTTGESCSGKDRYGLIVRAPDNNQGYLYNVSCDGNYQLRIWDGQQFTDLITWTPTTYLFTGPEQTHRLGLKAEGSKLSLYINGFQITEIEDSTFAQGTFGVNIAATETAGFTFTVTEALYWELP